MAEVMVLGAGMVGVATALACQARGQDVVLVERGEPGRETSYGNAGIIQAEAVEPYAMPRDIASLLRIAFGRDNGIRYELAGLPGQAGALWRYFRASAPGRHRTISASYAKLAQGATEDHAPLIEAAGAGELIRRDGYAVLLRDPRAFEAEAREAGRLARDYGLQMRLLDAPALRAAEPALTGGFAGAVHWQRAWSCSDPGGLVAAYAALFTRRGGRIVQADAERLARAGAGWRLAAPGGALEAAQCVVALGPWSADFARRFGCRVPMVLKRGYHRHYSGGAALRMPLVDAASGTVASPMRAGLRVLTGAEIARPGTPPRQAQMGRSEAAIRELLELGRPVEPVPWLGTRPCLPGMLPLVGPVPGQPGLWFHFGHGHQGFTLGPTTAALLAEEMAGGPAPMPELSPAAIL
jgi:D-amino-acid dehydrogenase